jgi:hypothetical protein
MLAAALRGRFTLRSLSFSIKSQISQAAGAASE